MKWLIRSLSLLILSCLLACAANEATLPEVPEGKTPWTHTRFRNAPENFQFLITADRTGGRRESVFARAVDKINLLQPEFVMCVGDLVDGYTEDPAKIEAEWREFGPIAERLEMPFFRTAGNHDILKQAQKDDWPKRFGSPYYHFLYKNVLFVVLCSDWPKPNTLGDEQVAWLEKTLAANASVKWTFVFLHKPFWTYRTVSDEWKRVEAMLAPRAHTVFAGHYHNYTHYERHGQDYFILSTTGGGNGLEGAALGQFDQFVWVTMTEDGPRFANLEVDAVHDADLVTTATSPLGYTLRRSKYISVSPIVADGPRFQKGRAQIALNNPHDVPLHVFGRAYAHPTLQIEPTTIDIEVAPKAKSDIEVALKAPSGSLSVDSLDPAEFILTAEYAPDGHPIPVSLERTWRVFVDRTRAIPEVKRAPVIDGDLSEWRGEFLEVRKPAWIQGAWNNWKGVDDGAFAFSVTHDSDNLYIAVRSTDNTIVRNPEKGPWDQDGFLIELDADADQARERGSWGRRFKNFLVVELAPGDSPDKPNVYQADRLPKGTRTACVRTDTGLAAEIAIPVAYLNERQGKAWETVRINVGQIDVDTPPDVPTDRTALFWRPRWSCRINYTGSGTFARK